MKQDNFNYYIPYGYDNQFFAVKGLDLYYKVNGDYQLLKKDFKGIEKKVQER